MLKHFYKLLVSLSMICFSLSSMLLSSCESTQPSESSESVKSSKKTKEQEGIVKTYDNSGNLHTQITYEDGVKHGESLLFHKGSDQVMLKMNYRKGERHGDAYKYYKDGEIYAITPYKEDEVDGVVMLYFRNGNIKAQIPYYQSNHGLGLKEYFTNGDVKTDMPEINIRRQRIGGQNIYYFSVEDCNGANFYIGALLNNQFLVEEPPFVEILPIRNGEGIYGYPDSMKGETINIICKCITTAKNTYVTRKVVVL